MVSFDGSQNVRLTTSFDSVASPKFSPDGRLVSFVSTRAADVKPQIYFWTFAAARRSP